MIFQYPVIPVKTGIQRLWQDPLSMDSRMRENDEKSICADLVFIEGKLL